MGSAFTDGTITVPNRQDMPDPYVRLIQLDRVREPLRNESGAPTTRPSAVRLWRARQALTLGSQGIPNAATTQIVYDATEFDEGGLSDLANARFKLPADNVMWLLHVHVEWGSNATGYRKASILVNGSVEVNNSLNAVNGEITAHDVFTYFFNSTGAEALITATVHQTSGVLLSALGGAKPRTYFEALQVW